jgi:cytochrome bd-type quinol oxidase subunit 1
MATSKPVNATSRSVTTSQVPKDVWIYRMVVGILGGVILTAAITAFVAIVLNKSGDTPSIAILTSLSSAAIGALAGLLAPSPAN